MVDIESFIGEVRGYKMEGVGIGCTNTVARLAASPRITNRTEPADRVEATAFARICVLSEFP